MVSQPAEVRNAARREDIHHKSRKAKGKAKLAKRMATRKAEREDETGQLKQQRLANNIPRTIENTREWVGAASTSTSTANQAKKERANLDDSDEEGSDEDEEDQAHDDMDIHNDDTGMPVDGDDPGDAMTRPVQIKSNNPNDPNDIQLDMAGLEDLFAHQEAQSQADIEAGLPPTHKPILLTTSPRPHGPTYAFMNEFQSLLGGKKYVHIVPRKNARFELSKVCKWAAKRGYGAILVVGEDLHGQPATLTASLLPHGPCAHFRLTSVQLHRQISGSANPTSHIPELVLSNFSTPLGLSTGRLIQSLFPPLPQIIGRQVVAIHNQRDYIFIRRFRYMFAVREGEASVKAAIAQGRDKDLRTKMQEIGPRFTLKLRWLQKGALGTNRRKGGNGVTRDTLVNEKDELEGEGREQTKGEKEDEALARKEMLDGLGEEDVPLPLAQDEPEPQTSEQPSTSAIPFTSTQSAPEASTSNSTTDRSVLNKKRKRRTHSPGGTIHIPDFSSQIPSEIPKADLPHARKLKKNASILDSLAVTVGYGRGGSRKESKKEWEWNPRMQVSRRKFAL